MKTILFSTVEYIKLQREMMVFSNDDFEEGEIERRKFPDGEHYHRIVTDVAGQHVVLVGGTIYDWDVMEIYDLACALVKYGCKRLTLVIPYYGYSTMERAVKVGEVVPAKTRARLISSIPSCPDGNRVMLLDLHSEGICHYFEGSIRPVHVYAKSVILRAVRRLGAHVLACTDAGRAKWVESLANELNIPPAFVFKKRIDGSTTKVTAVSAQVEKKHVVIYDDMIRTGGSLIEAAKAYKDAGAKEISVVTTHGVFCGDAPQRLFGSKLFSNIISTNSHPNCTRILDTKSGDPRCEVISIAEILAERILKEP